VARLDDRPVLRGGRLALLANQRFGVLLGGNFLSAVGTFVHVAVTAWVLFDLTGSSAMVGVLTIAQYGPVVMLTLPAGVVIDHRDRRSALLAVMGGQMVLAFILAALVWTGHVSPISLMLITVGMGIFGAFGGPAWIAYVGDLIPPEKILVGFSLNSMSFHMAAFMGPPLGALLLNTVGPAASFAVNGISFFAIIGALLLMPRRPPTTGSFVGLRRAVGQMTRFARNSHRARRLLPVSGAIALVAFGLPAVLPAYATDVLHGSAGSYGALSGAMGAGSLSGAILMGVLGTRAARRTIILIGAWLVAAGMVGLALFGPMPVALASIVLIGCGQLMLLVTARTVIQMDAPEWLRARAVSLWFICAVGLGPMGGTVLGWMADRWGIRTSIAVCAAYAVTLAFALVAAARSKAGIVEPYSLDAAS
jgi:MFS family permease